MAKDATQVRVGVTGTLYRAPVGTALPATEAASWPSGWVDLGHLDEDSPFGATPSSDSKDIRAWALDQPVRSIQKSKTFEWKFKLIQVSGTNLKTAFGGGTIETLSAGHYQYHPPAVSDVDEFAIAVEVVDGSIIERWIMKRGKVSDVGEIPFKKDEAIAFELTVSMLGVSSGDTWTILSNDTAFAA